MARRRAADPEPRRTARLSVQLTPPERAELDARAEAHGVALSDYVRAVIFSRALPGDGRDPKALRELAAEVARVGNNLNQMALRANTAGQIRSEAALRASLDELAGVMAKVIEL